MQNLFYTTVYCIRVICSLINCYFDEPQSSSWRFHDCIVQCEEGMGMGWFDPKSIFEEMEHIQGCQLNDPELRGLS